MENNMYLLKKEFQRIRNMGYVKGVKEYYNCDGITFEKLLNKEQDELPIADYNGIEIKVKKGYSKSKIGLFSANPDNCYLYGLKDLYEKYGMIDKDGNRRFMLEINGVDKIFYNNHYFRIVVDRNTRIIKLNIYDWQNNLINEEVSWSFDLLEERINLKLKKLALVKCCTKKCDNYEYYWYYKIKFYDKINISKFIDAIESGKISIKFTIGIYKSGPKVGQLHNHGTTFSISEDGLDYIYDFKY